MVFGPCMSNFTAGAEKCHEVFYSPGKGLKYTQKIFIDKKLLLYDDPLNSPKATLTQVPYSNPIKPV